MNNNPPVITQIGHVDPNAVPLNVNGLIDLLNTVVTSEITGSYIPYIIDSITPGSDKHDYAWIQTDSQGRPLAIKIWYNGNWRRVYNGMLGEVRGYHGDPSVDFDTDGKGKIGELFDGWHLCNGRDGTPDLSDKFLLAGHMNNENGHVGYDNGWQSFIGGTDQKTGGEDSTTLTSATTYQKATQEVKLKLWSADGNAPNNTGDLFGLGANGEHTLIQADPGNTQPTSFTNLPPFIALGWIIFVGY